MMIEPPHIVTDQNLTENFKFRTSGLDMERWLIPPIIFTNQNLTENFKFEI